MDGLPNSGVKFFLGNYKIKVDVNTGYGRSRRLTIDSDGDSPGLYVDELFDRMQIDVENLRESAKRLVVDAKKERENEE